MGPKLTDQMRASLARRFLVGRRGGLEDAALAVARRGLDPKKLGIPLQGEVTTEIAEALEKAPKWLDAVRELVAFVKEGAPGYAMEGHLYDIEVKVQLLANLLIEAGLIEEEGSS